MIDTPLKAGRELDYRIAREVMCLTIQDENFSRASVNCNAWFTDDAVKELRTYRGTPVVNIIPKYSTDVRAAWEVIRAVQSGGLFSVRNRFWRAVADLARIESGERLAWPDAIGVLGDRFCEVICLAALEAAPFAC